ncbi:hypothetical protein Tco_0212565 [Tanacetum coccineum]
MTLRDTTLELHDMTMERTESTSMKLACRGVSQVYFLVSPMLIRNSNPTPYYVPDVSNFFFPTLSSLRDSDLFFLLEESRCIPRSLKTINLTGRKLNLPEIRKELKVCEAKTNKYSIDEPPEIELKDLPPHLEYAFLEGDDKLPITIA